MENNKKIKINMLAGLVDKVEGQGVGSVYLELVELLKDKKFENFEILIDSNKKCDINHFHTIELKNYFKMMDKSKNCNIMYVHFLPETLDGSIKLPWPAFDIFKQYVMSFYKQADYLIVVNPIFISSLVNIGIKREKIFYIPNYVSSDKFYKKSSSDINKIKKKLNIPENKFIVLGVGQVQTRKGVLDFVEVAKMLPDIEFVWAGGFSFGAITDGYKTLEKIVKNPPKNVKFLGIIPRDQMNDIYNIADILFVPSYHELFPMAILEAINLDKPLLVRDLELYKDILFEKYYKANFNDQFKELILKLKNDKKFYKQGEENSKYLNNFYSKEHISDMWLDFYTMVYNNRKKKKEKKIKLNDKK